MIVVKVGGSVICKDFKHVAYDLAQYNDVVLVHGGGCVVNQLMERMGLRPKFLTHPGGITSRYTDEETLKVYVMGMMLVNKMLVAQLNKAGVEALGLSGADQKIVVAKRKERVIIVDERGRQRVVDGGYTGRIVNVRTDLVRPPPLKVLAPVAVSEDGLLLNVDGDQLAYAIAVSLHADGLVMLTDVEGVLVGGEVVRRLSPEEAERLSRSPEVKGGMKRKVLLAAEAAKRGIRTIIASGLVERPLTRALEGGGTEVI